LVEIFLLANQKVGRHKLEELEALIS